LYLFLLCLVFGAVSAAFGLGDKPLKFVFLQTHESSNTHWPQLPLADVGPDGPAAHRQELSRCVYVVEWFHALSSIKSKRAGEVVASSTLIKFYSYSEAAKRAA
jgi:hypothetical protein